MGLYHICCVYGTVPYLLFIMVLYIIYLLCIWDCTISDVSMILYIIYLQCIWDYYICWVYGKVHYICYLYGTVHYSICLLFIWYCAIYFLQFHSKHKIEMYIRTYSINICLSQNKIVFESLYCISNCNKRLWWDKIGLLIEDMDSLTILKMFVIRICNLIDCIILQVTHYIS